MVDGLMTFGEFVARHSAHGTQRCEPVSDGGWRVTCDCGCEWRTRERVLGELGHARMSVESVARAFRRPARVERPGR